MERRSAKVRRGGRIAVLFIESDPELLARYAELTREAGLEVFLARDEHDALGLAGLVKIDVVLLDVPLPDLRGLDILRRLAAQPATARVPVILQTGTSSHTLPPQT